MQWNQWNPEDRDPTLCDAAAIEQVCDEAAGAVLDDLGSAVEGHWDGYLDDAELHAAYGVSRPAVHAFVRAMRLLRRDGRGNQF